MQEILHAIQHLIKPSNEELRAFTDIVLARSYKKKELILQEGQICKNVYFIRKGLIRYYQVKEGTEVTGQFFSENNWYTDLESFLTHRPSRLSIEALENSELLLLPKQQMEELYVKHPVFERLGRILAEQAFLGLKNRHSAYILRSPQERYTSFVKNCPHLVQRVPQHYIASYLGIQPQSLSRIRKRISLVQDLLT